MKRIDLISKAREYIDTPFHHQGRLKGVGVDCIGLIICTLKDLGVSTDDVIGYNSVPSSSVFLNSVNNQTTKVKLEDVKVGDLMTFSFGDEPQHIAFISEVNGDKIKIIHSFSWVKKVVEHDLDEVWVKRASSYHRINNIEFED